MIKPRLLPIPLEALEDCGAILGRRGAGKSATRTLFLEHELDRGRRCCLIDPKGDSWGIRLDPDGAPSRFQDVAIFGGSHGDVAIEDGMGEALGRLVATHDLSCIVDLSAFSVAGMRRFMRDFAEALFDNNTEPLTLFVDEADQLAPQSLPAEMAMLLHRMERLIRQGRQRGIFMWMLTQRPQVLNKNLLSQAESLVAMKMTTPHDRKAIAAWMEAHDPEQAREVMATLAKLEVGEAWVWVPPADFLERVQFPLFSTFDSMRTPRHGERVEAVKLPPIDMSAIAEALGAAAAPAPAHAPIGADAAQLLAAKDAEIAELRERERLLLTTIDRTEKRLVARCETLAAIGRLLVEEEAQADAQHAGVMANASVAAGGGRRRSSAETTAGEAEDVGAKGKRSAAKAPGASSTPKARATGADTAKLTGAQKDLLAGMAWWSTMGHPDPTKTQIAAKVGWKPKGSHLRNRFAELVGLGLVEYPAPSRARLTPQGAAVAPPPEPGGSLIASIRAQLSGAQCTVLDLMLGDRKTWRRAELAERLGWETGGSHLRNRLAELSALSIVEYPSRGEVRLQDWVQEP